MRTRAATHSGSWYSADRKRLRAQIESFLGLVDGPVKQNARILVGPHAGYTYAGKTLAQTYGSWDTSKVKRVFILGPSHHVYFKNVAYLSGVDQYETPLGNLPVDTEVVAELCQSKLFKRMDIDTDEDEHSFEMHAPFIYAQTAKLPQGVPKIVPIMISAADADFNTNIATILSSYLADECNTFVVSSDFCHWGARFGYTEYTPVASLEELGPAKLKLRTKSSDHFEIYQSIEYLDKYAMKVASTGSSARWKKYIQLTGNTICGQKPIAILLETIEIVKNATGGSTDYGKLSWIGYAQSSRVTDISDSSVSYASGVAVA